MNHELDPGGWSGRQDCLASEMGNEHTGWSGLRMHADTGTGSAATTTENKPAVDKLVSVDDRRGAAQALGDGCQAIELITTQHTRRLLESAFCSVESNAHWRYTDPAVKLRENGSKFAGSPRFHQQMALPVAQADTTETT